MLVGENTDAKLSSSETNKTSTSSTSTSQTSGRTRQQPTSGGGSIITSDSMSLDGFVYNRKRRDTFNKHALHQTVAPPSPPSFHDPLTGRRSVSLHEEVSGKIVHDPEHDADDGPTVKGATGRSIGTAEVAEDAPPESPASTTSGLAVPLVANISSTTTTTTTINYSHDRSTYITVDHLTSSSPASVFDSDRASSSALTSVRSSPGDTSTKFHGADEDAADAAVASGAPPIAKLARVDAADFERDTGNALASESSDIAEGSRDGTAETTTSASGVESAKLGADSSDYDEVVSETTAENDSGVSPANYSGNPDVADGNAAEPTTTASSEIRLNEPTEDRLSHVSNSDSGDVLLPVELDREQDAGTLSLNGNVDETASLSTTIDENTGRAEEDAVGIEVVEGRDEDTSGERRSSENDGDIAEKSAISDVVKETRELSREYSSSESEASSAVVAKAAERSEELQRDSPVPIYSYGQNEVEIVDLRRGILDNDVKTNAVFGGTRDKNELRIVARERNDEEFLRNFEKKFRETAGVADGSAESSPSIKTDRNSPDTLHDNAVHDSSGGTPSNNADHPSNSPITQHVQIVEVPVYRDAHSETHSRSSSSSSSHRRVLINVTIATEDASAVSSRPLYVLSVSVPTEGDAAAGPASGININQAQVRERPAESYTASMKKIPANDAAVESIHAVDTRLPPPPQPPASPPAPPVWAGGECECSCPCMGSSSDEWDNFSAIDDSLTELQELDSLNSTLLLAEQSLDSTKEDTKGGKEEEFPSSANDSVSIDASPTTEDYYPSSTSDDIAETSESLANETIFSSTHEPDVSTDTWACSGTTLLPPEPIILILEGEASFIIVFLFSLCTVSVYLSLSIFPGPYFFSSSTFTFSFPMLMLTSLLVVGRCRARICVDLPALL